MGTPKKGTIQSALCPSPSKPPQPKDSSSQPAKPPKKVTIRSTLCPSPSKPPESKDSSS